MTPEQLERVFRAKPVFLAPMEDVTDAPFRRLCRARGAELCVTEFVNVEGLLRGSKVAQRKLVLAPDDQPTAIQIYGADAERLAEAALVAADAGPAWLDINCGCWVPKVARRGAGAGWLRDPAGMVAMAKLVVDRVGARLPVTVKTRLGYDGTVSRGAEPLAEGAQELPIVELARRLEDVGVRALTLHCRTAEMGHSGEADWRWAAKVREVVKFPVIVNGDVTSADDAERALAQTGCDGVMIGRRAIAHPWVFREVRARLERGETVPPPTPQERFALCREHLAAAVEERGAERAVPGMRRYYAGYLSGLPGSGHMRRTLNVTHELPKVVELLHAWDEAVAAGRDVTALA